MSDEMLKYMFKKLGNIFPSPKFIPHNDHEKELGEEAKPYTNVYINNFGDDITDEMLKEMFEKFGNITSHKVMCDDNGKSRGFGFVTFKDSESAKRAVDELNGKEFTKGKVLYVGRAQNKAERQQELKRKFGRNQEVNLYVKNLDKTIDDERLRKEFAPFGTVTSAKVMLEKGRSKGFGFVCFSSPEEAAKAVTEMNNRIIGSKALYVGLAQNKEDRKAHLASQYYQHTANMRMQLGLMYQSGGAEPSAPKPAQMRPQPCWPAQPIIQPHLHAPGTGFPAMHSPYCTAQIAPTAAQPSMHTQPITGQLLGIQGCGSPISRPTNYKYTANMRNPPQPMPVAQQSQVHQAIESQEPLTNSMLAAALPHDQKQMLGERLYPLVQLIYPDLAGKITGMLLETDNAELLHMLEQVESLKANVEKAVAVLQTHSESTE